MFDCPECGKSYRKKASLFAHKVWCGLSKEEREALIEKQHSSRDGSLKTYSFVCSSNKCDNEFEEEIREKKYQRTKDKNRFCSNSCARSFSTQAKREEINEKISETLTGRKITAYSQECRNSSCSKVFDTIPSSTREYCSEECIHSCEEYQQKMRKIAQERGFGGQTSRNSFYYEKKSGEEVCLHSTYEVRVAESLDKNGISWIRPDPLGYFLEEKNRLYYPDFYLPKFDVYLDPKNSYLIEKDRDKIHAVSEQNEVEVLVLSKEQLSWSEIKEILDRD